MIELPIRRLRPDARLPARAYDADAGLDLAACERVVLEPGERAVVGTGLAVAIPEGYAGFVMRRSGLAANHGVTVLNAPGVIDAGYRGEVKVILVNHDLSEPVRLRRLDRIAQLVVQKVEQVRWREAEALPDSARGAGGHGSTGGHSAAQTEGG